MLTQTHTHSLSIKSYMRYGGLATKLFLQWKQAEALLKASAAKLLGNGQFGEVHEARQVEGFVNRLQGMKMFFNIENLSSFWGRLWMRLPLKRGCSACRASKTDCEGFWGAAPRGQAHAADGA